MEKFKSWQDYALFFTSHMTSNLRQNPILSIKNVSKSYENGFKALNNINLQIKNGEIVAILGSNGAGKTTLISIICGIVSMSLGEVLVAGENILDNFPLIIAIISHLIGIMNLRFSSCTCLILLF